jgi:hypothetical protein
LAPNNFAVPLSLNQFAVPETSKATCNK